MRYAEDAGSIELRDALGESVIDELEVSFGVGCCQEAGEPILNVNSAQAQVIEQQRRQRMFVMDVEEEPAGEALDLRLQTIPGEQLVQVRRQRGSPLRDSFL